MSQNFFFWLKQMKEFHLLHTASEWISQILPLHHSLRKKKTFINIIFLNYITKVFYPTKYPITARIKIYCYGFVKFNFFIFQS